MVADPSRSRLVRAYRSSSGGDPCARVGLFQHGARAANECDPSATRRRHRTRQIDWIWQPGTPQHCPTECDGCSNFTRSRDIRHVELIKFRKSGSVAATSDVLPTVPIRPPEHASTDDQLRRIVTLSLLSTFTPKNRAGAAIPRDVYGLREKPMGADVGGDAEHEGGAS
jgi:hypothetical protein